MSYSVAHMGHIYRAVDDSNNDKKEIMRHRLAMAKYQARREIDLRIAQKVRELDLERVRQQILRKKDSALAGYVIIAEFVCICAYFVTVWRCA